ncbi:MULTISPECIES: hypothetical protein [unclassified Streptomyces]|uniref:hypothetical protein n=1 Tax=unclassified Streptomyces TaxID=2593676 RepID=UPI002DD8A0DE|nr:MULTISPECIES: hypothetical protein [unclassified Streptomyces]WSA97603.1 hypothetical protein OIE63_39465 [Streptomyces sp. NBC_01795]WSB82149.1 hypothetical protein OHB04_41350 [Streptomyces sp. NBC_01775]WSS18120.1 hypothetical protein OG533_40430 [Streptomyces sp. NBC_01186]WSS46878.1 hypothetical protein OG220_40715 [Streptomyces sp. NBC_01187]
MDTTELEAAYRNLLRLAESIPDTAGYAASAREDIDWTLSHIALSDPLLTEAARDIHRGRHAIVDIQDAMDQGVIAELIASTTHRQRVAMVRDHAHALREALGVVPDQAADSPVLLRLFDRAGAPLPEQHMPWQDLIALRATTHIPGHTARIKTYASAEDGTRDA